MRFLTQWISLLVALLILVGMVGVDLYQTHEAIGSESQDRLQRQAEVVNKNLTQRLQATSNALDSIRSDLPQLLGAKSDMSLVNRRLQALVVSMVGMRSFAIANAAGVSIASNRQS